ncbi:MAG: three-Cys-motif partner protein TcmP [Reyranella sp.]|nr:three-Cys-motif partner protein TcmP [Reyranella sp.]
MISRQNYVGREQAYVKHLLLETYLERLVHKTAKTYDKFSYVEGFAGPWQSTNERYEDTSFGIALAALRRAKASWRTHGRDVQMYAFLVEQDQAAFERLQEFAKTYPDITIRSYRRDFVDVADTIVGEIPQDAFSFFFIDPKGWRIPIKSIASMLSRPNSEVVFNFMFEFINRAASIQQNEIVRGLQELIPYGDWRSKLEALTDAENTSDRRKEILINAFSETLERIGQYQFVAETPIYRPLRDRTLYSLMFATRHEKGVEVFRDSQVKALRAQSALRAETKVQTAQRDSGQGEMFASLNEMQRDETEEFLNDERAAAIHTLANQIPEPPAFAKFGTVMTNVLKRHVVTAVDVRNIAVTMRGEGRLAFPDWQLRKRVPDSNYRVQRVSERRN